MATILDSRGIIYKDIRHLRSRKLEMEGRLLSFFTILTLVHLGYLLFFLEVTLPLRSVQANGDIKKLSF